MKQQVFLKARLVVAALSVMYFTHLVKAQGNLVVNGGFDANSAGWTLAGNAVFTSYGGDPAGCIVLVSSGASATQTINGLTSGSTYIVSGDYSGVLGVPYPYPTFEVTMDGAILFETIASGNNSWYNFDFLYTAVISNAALSLELVNPDEDVKTSYLIDNISMQAVPEPSASVLITLGGGVIYVYKRKRKCLCS